MADGAESSQDRCATISDSVRNSSEFQDLADTLQASGFENHAIEDGFLWTRDHLLPTEMASELLRSLIDNTKWIQPIVQFGSRTVPSPRLAAWHGDPGAVYTYSGYRNSPAPWTEALQEVRAVLKIATHFEFNSVLLNYYRDGNDSMGWHRDNEKELGPEPVIASVSLGEARRFRMQHMKNKQQRWETELGHGSTLIMAGKTQKFWRHCVPKSKLCKAARINMTFRQVNPVN